MSGGGTGGHIYPAIAIADTIKSKYPDAEIIFTGNKGAMEETHSVAAGYKDMVTHSSIAMNKDKILEIFIFLPQY